MVGTYRKIATIEAWQNLPPNHASAEEQPMWLIEAAVNGTVLLHADGETLTIKTREGDVRADFGDWIARGVEGELWPIKPSIFSKTYERV